MLAPTNTDPLVATDEEAATAKEAVAKLKALTSTGDDVQMRVAGKSGVVPLPARAVGFIVQFLSAMAERQPVSVVPHTAELTTQEAADFLNVSRPFLVGLLETKKIPFHKVGTHRRVRFEDLIKYNEKFERERRAAMEELAEQAQKLGMGY